MKVHLFLVLLTSAFLMFVTGCRQTGSDDNLQDEITGCASQYVGTADAYRAEIGKVSGCEVEHVRLVGYGVRPDPNLVIDPLTLELQGVQYESQPFRVRDVGAARFKGRISEAAINYFVQRQGRTDAGLVKDIRIELQRGQVKVTGYVQVMQADVMVTTTGRVRVDEGLRLMYEPEKMIGIGIPKPVRGLLVERVNPLVDLSGLRFDPRVTGVSVHPGAIHFEGAAALRMGR